MKTLLNALYVGTYLLVASGSTHGATLKFDGIDDSVALATDGPVLGTNFTQEAWIHPQFSDASYHGFLGNQPTTAQGRSPSLWVVNQTALHAGFGTGSEFVSLVTPTNVLQRNAWNHVAATYDGVAYRVYVNGEPVFSTNIVRQPALQPVRWIGRVDNFFPGLIDEVRLWNVARSPADIAGSWSRRLAGNEPGLAAYYVMEEGAGTVTADVSGHGFSGGLAGGVLWNNAEDAVAPVTMTESASWVTATDAQLNTQVNSNGLATTTWFEWGAGSTALEFDGVNDYVSVIASVNLANRSFTVEAWAWRHTIGTVDIILGQGVDSANQGLHFAFRDNNRFTFAFYGNDLDTPADTDKGWHHWAGTYDASTRKRCIYRDGTLVATDIASANYSGTGALRIGDHPTSSTSARLFDGVIDEVRIWSVARSAAEVQANMNMALAGGEPGLLAYYRLDEGIGSTAADATGHGLTGTLVNGPVWATGARPVFDQATTQQSVAGTNSVLNLDGVDDYVDVPDGVWFSGNFTIEAKVYLRNYSSYARLIDFGNGPAQDNVYLALSSSTSGQFEFSILRGSTGQGLTSPVQVPLNQWCHLAATYEGTIATLYLNGVVVATGAVQDPQGVTRTSNFIGRSNWSTDSAANALFDNVRIWSTAVAPGVIRQWMNEPASASRPDWSDLAAEWRFDEASGSLALDASLGAHHGVLFNGAARRSAFPASAILTNLTPGTVYHFRSVAESSDGVAVGTTERFATPDSGGGTALQFDGADDYVRVANFGGRMPTTEVTVEFWQRTHSLNNQSTFGLEPDQNNNRFQAHVLHGGQVYWDFGNINSNGRLNYTPPVSIVGTWQHFAMVSSVSGNFMRIYRNGILEASKTGASSFTPGAHDLFLGRLGPAYFDGELDEFRIWNVARSEEQILADWNARLFGTETGLVAYYRMDVGTGRTLFDATTNSEPGLIVNGPQWVPSTAPIGLPLVTTEETTDITLNGAAFHGRVSPAGSGDYFWFEWGTDLSFGHTNTPQSVSGSNSVLNLDGVDDYVDVPDGLWLSDDFTIEAEVFLRSYGRYSRLMDFGNGERQDNILFALCGNLGPFYLEILDGVASAGAISSPVPVPLNEWRHLAVTFRRPDYVNPNATLFLNGVAVASGIVGDPRGVTRTNIFIGRSNWSADSRANAMFDNVRIWNAALAPDTLREWIGVPLTDQHPDWGDLAAEWRFDEADGTIAIDSSVNLRHGSLASGATRIPSVPISATVSGLDPGTVYYVRCAAQNSDGTTVSEPRRLVSLAPGGGTALAFDGVNQYVPAIVPGLPVGNSPYSIEAWIKPNVMNNGGVVGWGNYGVNNQATALRLEPNGLRHYWWNNDLVATNASLTGAWHHVAAVFDGTTRRLYLDGNAIASDMPTGHNVTTAGNFAIGRTATTEYFNGQIDEVRIWNVARTTAQIQQALYSPLTGNEPGLVVYFRMDEGAGLVLRESTPQRNHGLLVNGPLWAPSATPFFAVTMQATDITRGGGTLNGLGYPNGVPTIAWFEWGFDSSYGQVTAASSVGSGTANVPVTSTLSGLGVGEIYHYLLVSSNSFGVFRGPDLSFSTLGTRDVNFGLALQYGTNAIRPAVAIDGSNVVVQLHKSNGPGGGLFYRVGRLDKATLDWGPDTSYAFGFRANPAVAINADLVVEMHEQVTTLECNVGRVSGNSIDWGSITNCGDGQAPAIGLNDQGVVVEVHSSGADLLSRVGAVSGNSINWAGNATSYDRGESPALALNNQGQIVEVHESANKLYYRVGHLSGNSIVWTNSYYYDDGRQPSVALTDDGYVIEVHTSANLQNLTRRVGRINNDTIDWLGPSEGFDSGASPSVACNGHVAIQTHTNTNGVGLDFSTSLLTDRASWMQDRLDALYDMPLNRMVLPASHDAAMYMADMDKSQFTADWDLIVQTCDDKHGVWSVNDTASTFRRQLLDVADDACFWIPRWKLDEEIPSVNSIKSQALPLAQSFAITQTKSISAQLNLGIRSFDLRPKFQDGAWYVHHSQGGLNISQKPHKDLTVRFHEFSVTGPPLAEVLSHVKTFMSEGHRELVILNFSHFLKKNTDQPDLDFSDGDYTNFINQVTNSLGRWLFTSLPAGRQRLSEVTLGEFLPYEGAILVFCGDGFPTRNPRPGIWASSSFPVSGSFANKDDYTAMTNDQYMKFVTNCVAGPGATSPPDDMFGFWWTLTVQPDNSEGKSILGLASIANPNLGATMAEWPVQNAGGCMANLIWADFVEQPRMADVALFQMSVPHPGPEPPPAPTLRARWHENQVELHVGFLPNVVVEIQQTTDLANPAWATVHSITNAPQVLLLPRPAESSAFWRAVVH